VEREAEADARDHAEKDEEQVDHRPGEPTKRAAAAAPRSGRPCGNLLG
jgi:hypothetical protein